MSDCYPPMVTKAGQIERSPRRIRAVLAGHVVLDTSAARYVWEKDYYPQYYIPAADVDPDVLVDEQHDRELPSGTARSVGLRVGEVARPAAGHIYSDGARPELAGLARFEWDVMDAWYEEDEQIFVHPRSPYVRVDAVRSTHRVRVELDGAVLAESASPVLLFETGLPTRYYLNRSEVDFAYLAPSDTVSACPYKGRTTGYWSVRVAETTYPDLAWCYDYPTREVLPIAGMICFYNEKLDIYLYDELQDRPATHF